MKKTAIIIIALLLFSIIFSLLIKWVQTGNPFRAETIMFGAIVFLNTIVLFRIAGWLFKKYATKNTNQLKRNLLPAYLLFVLAALGSSLVIVSLGVYVFYLIKGLDTSHFIEQLLFVELASAVKQFAVWILIGSAFFFYIIWRKAIEREQKLRVENLKYKYQNLKAQVNPHFLFNSFNTLSEMVYEDSKKADNYIQKLSGIYRYILENEEVDLISLKQEIEFVKQYFDLQKMRDNDKIQLDIQIKDSQQIKIVPVSLQILVENALKHNARSVKSPLIIQIYLMENYIVVSNNIDKKNIVENSSKTGLSNLRERIKLICKQDLIVLNDHKQFIVKLPFIVDSEK